MKLAVYHTATERPYKILMGQPRGAILAAIECGDEYMAVDITPTPYQMVNLLPSLPDLYTQFPDLVEYTNADLHQVVAILSIGL